MSPPADDDRDAATASSGLGTRVLRALPKLSWTDSNGAHELTLSGRVSVGSAPGAGLVLLDATVSRLHAELEPRPDGIWVRDLGSRTGTYLTALMGMGDAILVRDARVPLGRAIRFGSVEIAVSQIPGIGHIELWRSERFGPLVGGTPVMRELFAELARVAPWGKSVLVHGEPGAGKRLVARGLHEASPRASAPFVVIDCAGPTPTSFEVAAGSTVLFREVGELSLSAQAKLRGALGADFGARIVSTSTRDLRRLVNIGAFDEELYFRLAQAEVWIPTLRERREDVVRLAAHFLGETIGAEMVTALGSRPWLGNVRELRAFVDVVRAHGLAAALRE